jgi:hypothetical protein
MTILLPGDEFEHEKEGRVSISNIKQDISKLDVKDGVVKSKTSEEIIVEFYSYKMGMTGQQTLTEFLENINRA